MNATAFNTKDSNAGAAIEASGVWKIFGEREAEAFAAIRRDGLGKAEVLEQFNCVVGVADVSFSVARGEIFCIMGLSGSGKSTLVRHINRLLTPTAGSIHVAGQDIMAMDDAALRDMRNRHIAMVFQDFGLMPHRSVRDNVSMALEIRKVPQNARWAAADKALAMVELFDWRDKFAHELSGGMQQRVGLARAIAADAEVLLMDEPFSALDPLIRRQLQTEFMQLAAKMKKTTLFITHDLEEAVRIGDRIAIMRDGVIVQVGTAEEIVMHPVDEYVSDFVSGISRLNLIRAHTLMKPVAQHEQMHGPLPIGTPSMREDATLNQLIAKAVNHEGAILIHDADDRPIGIVSRKELLEGVVAGTPEA